MQCKMNPISLFCIGPVQVIAAQDIPPSILYLVGLEASWNCCYNCCRFSSLSSLGPGRFFTAYHPTDRDRALFHSFDANQRRRSLVASGRAAVPAAEGREGAQEPSFRAKAVDEEISQQPCARVLMFLLYIILREGITTAPFLLHKCAFVPHLGLGFL